MAASDTMSRREILNTSVEVAIRLAVLAGLVVWCLLILRPFVLPLIWGIIIAVATMPIFLWALKMMGGRRGLTATVFTLLAIVVIVIPTFQIADSAVRSSVELARELEAETLVVPPPPESVREWPLIGNRTYDAWALAATNLGDAVQRFSPQLRTLGGWILGQVAGLAGAIGHTLIALIVAGFMLTWAVEGRAATEAVFERFGGPRGPLVVQLIRDTISSVFKGVLGVALIQAALAGIGMFLAGVPAWGVWTVLVLILAVVQVPGILVLGPIAFWGFANADSTLWGAVFAIYLVAVALSDNFLKPLLLGRGVEVPMPVILLGAIGGLILHGIIGLFVGAIVLATGYELAGAWLRDAGPPDRNPEADAVGDTGGGAPAPA